MGFLRRGDDADGTRYRMREKLFAIGDDFWIETESGERAFKVNGKALRIRDTFVLEDASGEELFKAQKKVLHVRDTMKVERDGETVATIKKALIAPLRQRFSVEFEAGGELSAGMTDAMGEGTKGDEADYGDDHEGGPLDSYRHGMWPPIWTYRRQPARMPVGSARFRRLSKPLIQAITYLRPGD